MAQGYVPGVQMPQPTDAQLGFKPSSAPPLDASVAQFVAPPIINRFRETSTVASNAAVGPGPAVSGPEVALNAPAGASPPVAANGAAGEGGPEAMSGAVVANFDALQGGSANPTSVYASANGMPPSEVVMFPNDTTILSADGKVKVKEAYDAYMAQGGRGYIRVVGHSSSRTADMPLKRHLMLNFEKSQARANSVARALIKLGVPASKVLVEAVGDSQPVYYESMPAGEEGNRRAEIFIQS
jgi:outer membrane protein OmpA-like peptidoglycan-associated protein